MKRTEILKRRGEFKDTIFKMIVNGCNPSEIADKIGCNKRYVFKLASKAIEEYQSSIVNVARVHSTIDLARIEMMLKAVLPKASDIEKPDKYAIETALKLLDRKAKLLGLDKPAKVDVSVNLSLSQLVTGSQAIEVESTVVDPRQITLEQAIEAVKHEAITANPSPLNSQVDT